MQTVLRQCVIAAGVMVCVALVLAAEPQQSMLACAGVVLIGLGVAKEARKRAVAARA